MVDPNEPDDLIYHRYHFWHIATFENPERAKAVVFVFKHLPDLLQDRVDLLAALSVYGFHRPTCRGLQTYQQTGETDTACD